MIGQTLNHYRITAKLGEGGMGAVYAAEDEKLGRRVAVKVLPADLADDPERLARFQREARAVAALNHPNIVVLHSVEEAEGTHFLTMELVEGRPLGELVPAGGLALEEILRHGIALADAVSAAHDRGITHRDLKPSNVMVNIDGRVKVLDFGLAKLTQPEPGEDDVTQLETASLTGEGKILGTVAHMSPEQAEGKPVDSRTDVFALGTILYQMATGERPFRGDTAISVISSILKDHPPPVTELRDGLPRHLARIVGRCLEKNPEHRYQSAKDLRNELAGLKREIDSGQLGMSSGAGTGAAGRPGGGAATSGATGSGRPGSTAPGPGAPGPEAPGRGASGRGASGARETGRPPSGQGVSEAGPPVPGPPVPGPPVPGPPVPAPSGARPSGAADRETPPPGASVAGPSAGSSSAPSSPPESQAAPPAEGAPPPGSSSGASDSTSGETSPGSDPSVPDPSGIPFVQPPISPQAPLAPAAQPATVTPPAPLARSATKARGGAIIGLAALALVALGVILWINREPAPAAAPTLYSFGTADNVTGTYYPLGVGLARLLERRNSEVAVEVLPTEGSFQNAGLMDRGEIQLALMQSDVAFHSVKTDRVLGHRSDAIVGLAVLYREYFHVLVRADAGIDSILDFPGHTVNLNLANSGSRFTSDTLLDHFGIDIPEEDTVFLATKDANVELLSGALDVSLQWVGMPHPNLPGVLRNGAVRLLSVDPELTRGLQAGQPFLLPGRIPPRTYPLQEEPVDTVVVKALLVGHRSLPDAFVTQLLDTLFAGVSDLIAAHPRAAEISPDAAFGLENGMSIELHPAAEAWRATR